AVQTRSERHSLCRRAVQLFESYVVGPWSSPCSCGAARPISGRARWLGGRPDGTPARWLLLLSAVMFSMSGCASVREWCREGAPGRAPCWMLYASAHHMAFSMKSHKTAASITDADREAAAREGWWGRVVPPQEKAAVESASAPTPADKGAPDDAPADGSK